jgi:hypothetical protein
MEQLTRILQEATEAIGEEYFLLPIHGADPVYRERVYCYELYHQMRLRWPDGCVYRLNGEVDKIGHPYFQDGGAPKPDLLVHQSGYGNNYAIVEVKSCGVSAAGLRKDVNTLSRFGSEFGYQRAIYLIYGPGPDQMLARVQECAAGIPHQAVIELWLHATPNAPAALNGEII